MQNSQFLPISKQEASQRGQLEVDVVLITGDAYVDHPAFGAAIIGRILESHGYRVGIIAMPDWRNPGSIKIFGRPRLFFAVTSGNVDSMIARYTAFKRIRRDDPYAPGGKAGHKPDRALIVYCNLVKAAYKDLPIVIGGIEASMRRIAHYDFWSNRIRRSILEDSRADILVYGMGEAPVIEIASRLSAGLSLAGIPGTVSMSRELPENSKLLPSEERVFDSKKSFLEFYKLFYRNQQRLLAQPAGKRFILHNPPPDDLDSEKLDAIYALPFALKPHPFYKEPIPAFNMIRNSITSHRGCVCSCSFCSLTLHQGKKIISRSMNSILNEVEKIAGENSFNGHITDIGGPSANNYGLECSRNWKCNRESCTFPQLCPNLQFSKNGWTALLKRASQKAGVSGVTVGSGIRYDLFMRDPAHKQKLEALIANHISGQLKIAPEHTSSKILRAMRKSSLYQLDQFVKLYRKVTLKKGKPQHLLPYLMSCHPGCELKDMKSMKKEIYALFGFVPHQVQAFIPLPMTLSSVIYYTGIDPLTHEQFFVERDMNRRRKQHDVFFSK